MTGIRIETRRERVEELLARYRDQVGIDFDGYRNHVYRCVTYAMHFLSDSLGYQQLVETAFAYHDIGLWTDHELAYLEPSEAVAIADNDRYGWGLDADALRGAIHWHHKLFRYRGQHEELIEACRKADWIDASQGWIRKGMSRSAISEVESVFPNCGFHQSLMRLAKDFGGSTLVGGWKVTRGIVKW
ncbi:MAG: phosphohydrolase [Planctomycetota bacterium]